MCVLILEIVPMIGIVYYLFQYAYYSSLLLCGGMSLIILGIYVLYRFGFGPCSSNGSSSTAVKNDIAEEEEGEDISSSASTFSVHIAIYILVLLLKVTIIHACGCVFYTEFNSDVSAFNTNVNDYNRNSEAGTGTAAAVYLGSFRMAPYLNYFPSLLMIMKDDFFRGSLVFRKTIIATIIIMKATMIMAMNMIPTMTKRTNY